MLPEFLAPMVLDAAAGLRAAFNHRNDLTDELARSHKQEGWCHEDWAGRDKASDSDIRIKAGHLLSLVETCTE